MLSTFLQVQNQITNNSLLAPSYRILFDNIDSTVNNESLPNVYPLHLKCILINGLPVDELPCMEVWDVNEPVFSSYEGMEPNKTCTWSADYGDGSFDIFKDVIGIFLFSVDLGVSMLLLEIEQH